jgi:hypothetical protein
MEYGKLSEIVRRIIAGKAKITRLDKAEEQGRIAGGCRNVESSIILGTTFRHNPSEQRGALNAINEISAQQKIVLKAYADELQKSGVKLWYCKSDIEEIRRQAIAQSGGAEADVYFMPNGNVIKIVEHYGAPLVDQYYILSIANH